MMFVMKISRFIRNKDVIIKEENKNLDEINQEEKEIK